MADEVLNPTTPANNSSPWLGASFMRTMQAAILNALNKDHYIGDADEGTGGYDDSDLGEHNKITLREASADPTTASNKGFLYTKDVNGITELFYRDSSGDITQLTNDGYLGGDNKLILTSDTSEANAQASVVLSNKSTDAPSSFSHYSDIQFLGKLSAIIAKITGSHYGSGADDKGQIQLTVNDGSAGEKVFLLTPDTVDAGTRLISNVADPVSNQDAATKKYVDDLHTAWTGAESIVFPNGMIMKHGVQTLSNTNWADETVEFDEDFPSDCVSVQLTGGGSSITDIEAPLNVHTITKSSFKIRSRIGTRLSPVYWLAIGY